MGEVPNAIDSRLEPLSDRVRYALAPNVQIIHSSRPAPSERVDDHFLEGVSKGCRTPLPKECTKCPTGKKLLASQAPASSSARPDPPAAPLAQGAFTNEDLGGTSVASAAISNQNLGRLLDDDGDSHATALTPVPPTAPRSWGARAVQPILLLVLVALTFGTLRAVRSSGTLVSEVPLASVAGWECSAHGPNLPQSDRRGGTIEIQQRLVGLVDRTPVSGARFRSCGRLDVACASPLGEAFTDSDGNLRMNVPAGFDGYYEIEGPGPSNAESEWMPTLRAADAVSDERRHFPIAIEDALVLPRRRESAVLAKAVGHVDLKERGMLATRVRDCSGRLAPGVRFSLSSADTDTRGFYMHGLPIANEGPTSESGDGGFLNVPAGVAMLSARVVGTAGICAQQVVLVRAGWFSLVDLRAGARL